MASVLGALVGLATLVLENDPVVSFFAVLILGTTIGWAAARRHRRMIAEVVIIGIGATATLAGVVALFNGDGCHAPADGAQQLAFIYGLVLFGAGLVLVRPKLVRALASVVHDDLLRYQPRVRRAVESLEPTGDTPRLGPEHLTHEEELISRIWQHVYGLRAETIAVFRLSDQEGLKDQVEDHRQAALREEAQLRELLPNFTATSAIAQHSPRALSQRPSCGHVKLGRNARTSTWRFGSRGAKLVPHGVASGASMTTIERAAADWERVESVYRQGLRCMQGPGRHLPDPLPPFLAELFARQSVMYQGLEDRFLEDGLRMFLTCHESADLQPLYFDRDESFPAMYREVMGAGGRRRPLPIETFVETTRRLRDLSQIEHRLSGSTVGGVLGGSMSYGRFFNVRGNRDSDPSDLDVLVVVSEPDQCEEVVRGLAEVPGIAGRSIEGALERFSHYRYGLIDGLIRPGTIFSHKFGIWIDSEDPFLNHVDLRGGYSLSIHMMPAETFDLTILRGHARADRSNLGPSILGYDYRETEPNREDQQRCFSGEQRNIPIDSNEHCGSYIRETHLFYIDDDDRYFPGMVQNLILPGFDIIWGDRDFRRSIDTLRWKMIERLRLERRLQPNEVLRLSFSHTRSHEFAPYIVRAVDSSTLVP